ncbi:hypothetical protein [Methylophilus sp. UBA6697]|jgi:hypothetical protein|uniref:hypothetical protein n=1 Tax=Methylophilus sp. UBA6697 TaxID=1946902 RepID=UPI000EC7BE0F|nr:hypothetical protein [Methylophilus sp. UBA6697]HCU84861.1 hypothetical protein [Methylophilus sp.]
MNSIVEFFEKLVTNFSWSRLTLTFVILVLLASSLFGYEAYTQHFALGRLNEQVKIFDQLVVTSEKINAPEKEQLINESYKKLMAAYSSQIDYKQVVSVRLVDEHSDEVVSGKLDNNDIEKQENISDTTLVSKYSFPEWFTKSAYILLPWFILWVLLLFSSTADKANALVGVMLIGAIFLVIGMALPSFKEYPWIMKWLYPWCAMIVFVSMVVVWDRRRNNVAIASPVEWAD